MKQLKFLNKTLLLLFIILAVVASFGFKRDAVAAFYTGRNNKLNYTFQFKSSRTFAKKIGDTYTPFEWRDKLSFSILRLSDMNNKDLMDTANENILISMTSWISDEVYDADDVNLSIFCHSDRYLSFLNSFEYGGNHYSYINDYITIDMQTGKRVMLNDLVEINEDFVEHILYGDIAMPSGYGNTDDKNRFKGYRESFMESDPAELLEMLNGCSLTNEQVAEAGYLPITESIGSLVFRDSFCLKEGVLALRLSYGLGKDSEFSVDDIEDFLKVEKW